MSSRSVDNFFGLLKLSKAAPSGSSVDNIANALNNIPTAAVKQIDQATLTNAIQGVNPAVIGSVLRALNPDILSDIAKKLPPELLNELPADVIDKIAKSDLDVLANAAGKIPDEKIVTAVKKLPEADQQSFMNKLKSMDNNPPVKKLLLAAALAGVSAGVSAVILKGLDKEAADELRCKNFCLPSNWDVTEYAGFGGKEAIVYSTLDSIKAANGGTYPSSPGNLKWDSTFPLCAAPTTSECDNFCKTKCDELVKSTVPGIDGVKNALPDFPNFPNFPDFSLSEETKKILKYTGLGLLVLFICILIYYLFTLF